MPPTGQTENTEPQDGAPDASQGGPIPASTSAEQSTEEPTGPVPSMTIETRVGPQRDQGAGPSNRPSYTEDEVEEIVREPAPEIPVQQVRTVRRVGDIYECYDEIHDEVLPPVVDKYLQGLRTHFQVKHVAHSVYNSHAVDENMC